MAIILGILAATLLAGTWLIRTTLPSAIISYATTYAPLANGSWFAFGASTTAGNTTTYFYSTNGTSWSSGTMPTSAKWNVCATNGTRVVVLNTGGSGAYTDNGTTWTTFTWAAGSDVSKRLIWDGTRFLAPNSGTSTDALAYSTNGATWSRTAIATNTMMSIGWDGSTRYIATRPISTSTAYTTTSSPVGGAGNWTTITLPSSAIWSVITYAAGIWVVAVPGSTSYATSTNGTTWTARTLPVALGAPFGSLDTPSRIGFIDGYFYYYSRTGSVVNFYRSTDGINWTDVASNYGFTTTELKTICEFATDGNFQSIAVGSGFSGTSDTGTTYYLHKTGKL